MQKYDADLAFYSPKDEAPKLTAIKIAAAGLAEEIIKQTLPSPEQTLALRQVEDAVLRAGDALARESNAKELEKERRQEKNKAA